MNILLVDDQNIVLHALHALLRLEIPEAKISKASNGTLAIQMIKSEKPDVVLLDVNMPGMNGLEVAEHIAGNYPLVKIIMLTNVDGKAMVLNLVKIAHGFLFKDVEAEELKRVIYGVLRGEKCFCSFSKALILNNTSTMDKLPCVHLEERESVMISMLAEGKTSKEMSHMLGLKEKTLNRYREDLLKKTKTKNTPELVAFAFHNGLI